MHDQASDMFDRVVFERSKRAKRLALRLDSKARIMRLVVPKHVSEKRAWAFAQKHYEWIEEQLCALPENIPFAHGQRLPILGTLRDVVVNYDESIKRTRIKLEPHRLYVQTNQQDPSMRIARFLRKEAQAVLERISIEKAEKIGKSVSKVSVRDTKSRWGSCSNDAAISYSWRLIFAPYEAMDYVVAHEVSHLKHMDHSAKFWKLCESLCDDYAEGKYWMREHGKELMAFG